MLKKARVALATILLFTFGLVATAQDDMMGGMEATLEFTVLGTYDAEAGFDEGAQEIGVFDAESARYFVTNAEANRIDVLDLSDPTNPTLIADITLDEFGDSINSVAVSNGMVAVAVEGPEVDSNGQVVFLTIDGEVVANVTVGILPDMVTFTPDGNFVLTANEGEPSDDYSIDPLGSVSIIDLSVGMEDMSDDAVTTLTFEAFNDMIDENVRVFGPNATVAQDLEPEYVAVSPDSSTAFVSLQENNAIAVVDIAGLEITDVFALGFKDYSLEENAADFSNEDGEINITTGPEGLFGMYQPDAIAAYEVDGTLYVVTANEGDARDYDTYSEEFRIGDEEVVLDEEAFPNAEELKDEAVLGRLLITDTLGDTDGDGDYDQLYNYGARSFSIFTVDGELVYDSGNDFETYFAENIPSTFNSQGVNDSFDNRSDDKGPEPEGLTIGELDGRTYAFITLERVGGIMVYDITDPAAATFAGYTNNVDLEAPAEEAGDIAPESVTFVAPDDSPTGAALMIVSNEVSGTTTVYEVAPLSMNME